MALIENLRTDLYKHYGFIDIENKDNPGKGCHNQLRFYCLYMEKEYMSLEDIAYETFTANMKYYIKRYNKTALQYIAEESEQDPDYKLILLEYIRSGL